MPGKVGQEEKGGEGKRRRQASGGLHGGHLKEGAASGTTSPPAQFLAVGCGQEPVSLTDEFTSMLGPPASCHWLEPGGGGADSP